MKLQVNSAGAWKGVLVFSVEHIELVKRSASQLAMASGAAQVDGKPVTWRIVDATETPVLMSDKQCNWYAPHWMAGREMVPRYFACHPGDHIEPAVFDRLEALCPKGVWFYTDGRFAAVLNAVLTAGLDAIDAGTAPTEYTHRGVTLQLQRRAAG